MASRYLVETLKLKKIGILQENTAYGEQVVAACQIVLAKVGVTPVGVEVFPITAPDLNVYVGNLRKPGADGVLFRTGSTPITANGFNSMHGQKYHPAIAGHSALFANSLLDLVPPEALQNVAGTYYKKLTWTDKEDIGARQMEIARKANALAETRGSRRQCRLLSLLRFSLHAAHGNRNRKILRPEKVKRAMDATKGYGRLLGTLNFTQTKHAAISVEDLTMATLLFRGGVATHGRRAGRSRA